METIIDTYAPEFGYELILIVPLVYKHHLNGDRTTVITTRGMRCFYYFLPEDCVIEKYTKRTEKTNNVYGDIHTSNLENEIFPDYKSHFKNKKLKHFFEKDILIVNNKYNTEWDSKPINFLDLNTLSEIFKILSPHFCLIYNRPRVDKIPNDNSLVYGLGDYELISKNFPNVIDMNELQEDYSFNELQLILGSKSRGKISVQGGSSILSSFTGGFNYIYAVKGGELEHNTFNLWYTKFSNSKIRTYSKYDALLRDIKKLNEN
jgi:hypothetical protein